MTGDFLQKLEIQLNQIDNLFWQKKDIKQFSKPQDIPSIEPNRYHKDTRYLISPNQEIIELHPFIEGSVIFEMNKFLSRTLYHLDDTRYLKQTRKIKDIKEFVYHKPHLNYAEIILEYFENYQEFNTKHKCKASLIFYPSKEILENFIKNGRNFSRIDTTSKTYQELSIEKSRQAKQSGKIITLSQQTATPNELP